MNSGASNGGYGENVPLSTYERAAAEWFFRRDNGLTPEEERKFSDWLREDRRHAEAFAQIETTWGALVHVRDKIDPIILNLSPSRRSRRILFWLPTSVGVAAAFAFAYLSWWCPAHFTGAAMTEIGGLQSMALPDGSVVELNSDSAVSIEFDFGERRVRLERGEVCFRVAKNPSRPFVVEAGGVAVRAVGTAFNVRMESQGVDVLVTEGKVQVNDAISGESLLPAAPRNLVPALMKVGRIESGLPVVAAGERVSIALAGAAPSRAHAISSVSSSEIERRLAWQNKRVIFSDASLSEIVAEFNRYNRHKLVIADPPLAQRRFGGSFPACDYDSFVQLLEGTFGVVADRRSQETVLRRSH